jgi:hypothetical protein
MKTTRFATAFFALATSAAPQNTIQPIAPRPDGKTRVFVGESDVFYSSSFYSAAAGGSANATAARASGGAFGIGSAGVLKFTINTMKALTDACPQKVVIVSSPDAADYFLRLDRDGVLVLTAKMVAFDRSGEMKFISTTHSISKDVKRFCKVIPNPSPPK